MEELNLSSEITEKYDIVNNTFVKLQVADVARKTEYEIGDIKQPDFLPQYKTKHWDNECNFSVRLAIDPTDAVVETVGNKIEWKKGIHTARFYDFEHEDKQFYEDGGFEFEVELSEKPESNVLDFTIQTKGLNFFYQSPLTQAELDEGMFRPENVVGSYAVYHSTKRDNTEGGKHYRTGKAFHIYRPQAVDSNGTTVWCELQIDQEAGTMKQIIPQDFLDNAVFPVIIK